MDHPVSSPVKVLFFSGIEGELGVALTVGHDGTHLPIVEGYNREGEGTWTYP